jgi:dTDP-4-amino-4,6-dideoxygalactose transaminase
MQHLLDKGIPCYLLPTLHAQAYLDERYKKKISSYKSVSQRSIITPMHTELDDQQIQFITDTVLEYLNKIIIKDTLTAVFYLVRANFV